ncbi:amidohydrolase family protein [Legionella clemsonensis]|uniref:4-sulfomuconolactone hydrolase n=1 Tax=Legionella clemsonensis TaxID=1867846 RepID=A0A222P1G6_9GAMM|nr:amidohydrolase family protein [Legionella clemsonensis]ASQ45704.1 4-sulfomuconolactone hydrolase [Legionella clemsonensis]
MQRICFFDSHFHLIDPRFPLVPNNNYLPSSFTIADYYQRLKRFNLLGGLVVSGSFQGFDQSYLLTCLQELGPAFVGIIQLPYSVSDDDILTLKAAGIRGVRFNIKRGGSESVTHLQSFAARIYELAQWHVELYIDARDLKELSSTLLALPAVSIDHLGLSKEGLSILLKLAEHGVKVKATGFGRVNFNVPQVLRDINLANPDTLMFGTDLPSTRAPRPFMDEDIQLILDTIEPLHVEKVLYLNALKFYKVEYPEVK